MFSLSILEVRFTKQLGMNSKMYVNDMTHTSILSCKLVKLKHHLKATAQECQETFAQAVWHSEFSVPMLLR